MMARASKKTDIRTARMLYGNQEAQLLNGLQKPWDFAGNSMQAITQLYKVGADHVKAVVRDTLLATMESLLKDKTPSQTYTTGLCAIATLYQDKDERVVQMLGKIKRDDPYFYADGLSFIDLGKDQALADAVKSDLLAMLDGSRDVGIKDHINFVLWCKGLDDSDFVVAPMKMPEPAVA